jgi:tRNA(Ser,Leu) C12 N-acetylase TAN1
MEVIKTFAASVGEGHEVNLEDPDLVILVDVTRVSEEALARQTRN